ncbi:MAG: methyltransferase [Methanotrichaceae archaeon]|nr:methyltransferase [Methanotrichaceae archaeon]
MNCPRCGKDCYKPADEIIPKLDSYYMACRHCAPDPDLAKDKPFGDLPIQIERCKECRTAPLDAVMLDILQVLVEHGLRNKDDDLRSVGSPLIAVGYPLAYAPRLGQRALIILGKRFTEAAAEDILKRVPEVKGVILDRCVPGVVDPHKGAMENVLLAGCDLRCDILQSLFGDLIIYKTQSKIHIEFPRQSAPKIRLLEKLYMEGELKQVVDGLCGPGTLGLMCALAGAERVVLNDIWQPAIENVILNLEANKDQLKIDKIEYIESTTPGIASEPVLVARASGACEIEVYQGDLGLLFSRAKPGNLCLIDHFPKAETLELENACSCCDRIVKV